MSSLYRPHNLSQRETEVIQLIADGLTDKEIAVRLCITPRTVSEHINNIRIKLGASNRASAVFQYFYQSLVQRARVAETGAAVAEENIMNAELLYGLRPADALTDAAEFAPTVYQIQSSTWLGSDSFLDVMSEKQTADALADGMTNPNHHFIVAEDAQHHALGYSQVFREPWTKPGGRGVNITVKQNQRGHGVGTALLADAEAYSRAQGVTHLSTLVADYNRAALRFATKHGFQQTGHDLAFELDLTRFDASRYDGLLESVNNAGVRITSIAEFDDSAAARRKLFQVNAWCAALDLPGVQDEPAWDSFEQFNTAVCGSGWYQPEGQIIAVDEQTGEWIGMAATTVNANGASNLHTGVDRRYRRYAQIGQGLKLASILYAKGKGATRLRDDHSTRDATNLAINYVMGYDIKAGVIYLEKRLA